MGGLRTGIRPVHITSASKMVTDFSGMPIQPHKVSRSSNYCPCMSSAFCMGNHTKSALSRLVLLQTHIHEQSPADILEALPSHWQHALAH